MLLRSILCWFSTFRSHTLSVTAITTTGDKLFKYKHPYKTYVHANMCICACVYMHEAPAIFKG